jgi:hypothetical protein
VGGLSLSLSLTHFPPESSRPRFVGATRKRNCVFFCFILRQALWGAITSGEEPSRSPTPPPPPPPCRRRAKKAKLNFCTCSRGEREAKPSSCSCSWLARKKGQRTLDEKETREEEVEKNASMMVVETPGFL